MDSQVTIVGGGPAGLHLSRKLKDKGIDSTVYESSPDIGRPVQCSGVFSNNFAELLDMPKKVILNQVKGAKLYSPSKKVVEVSREEKQADIVDRGEYDRHLAKGLDVKEGEHVNSLDFDSEYIVGADGAHSTVARLAGFPPLEKHVVGVQVEIDNDGYDKDFVELHLGQRVAPGFFAWIIPTDKNLRVGLGTRENPKEYLDRFIEERFGKVEQRKCLAGYIPMRVRKPILKGNVALVGDAAGQVKATTGGGIYMGMKSAEILADAIERKDLNIYEKRFRNEIYPDLKKAVAINNILSSMTDKEMDKFWDTLGKKNMVKLMQEYGDMDKPTLLLKGFLKNPGLITQVPFIRSLLR
jgi:geranylgeranyl reductase family protein